MKMHNVVTDNCEKIRPEYQPATVQFDYMKAGHSYRENTMSELKTVLEMTTTRPDTS